MLERFGGFDHHNIVYTGKPHFFATIQHALVKPNDSAQEFGSVLKPVQGSMYKYPLPSPRCTPVRNDLRVRWRRLL
jgi:hypothetical protein